MEVLRRTRSKTRPPQSRSRLAARLRAAISFRRRRFCRIQGLREAQWVAKADLMADSGDLSRALDLTRRLAAQQQASGSRKPQPAR
jgi:hypothetical protein